LHRFVGVHRLELAACLLDPELAALMCCDSALNRAFATNDAVWWHRYARQYEQWRDRYAEAAGDEAPEDGADRKEAVETVATGPATRALQQQKRDAEERRAVRLNWAWGRRNWQRFARPPTDAPATESAAAAADKVARPSDSDSRDASAAHLSPDASATRRNVSPSLPVVSPRYAEYRTWMLSSMGVRIVYAIVECDTHRFFAWLPYEDLSGVVASRERGFNITPARWIERRELRIRSRATIAEVGAAVRRYVANGLDSGGDPESSESSPLPPPASSPLPPRSFGERDHIPFVYSRTRTHHRDKAHECRREDVELGGLTAKLADMQRLAVAGVAFCVHAVVLYGNRFDDAATRAVKQHKDAITTQWCCGGDRGGDDVMTKEQDRAAAAATTRATSDEKSEKGDPVADNGASAGGLRQVLRGDIPRQRDGDDVQWGAAALRWPIKANICARRVTALYEERLYGDAVRHDVLGGLRRASRKTADSGADENPPSASALASAATSTSSSPVSYSDELVTELRQADGSVQLNPSLIFTLSTADCRMSHSEVLARARPLVSPDFPLQIALSLVAAVRHAIKIRAVLDPPDRGGYHTRAFNVLGAAPMLPLFSAAPPCPCVPTRTVDPAFAASVAAATTSATVTDTRPAGEAAQWVAISPMAIFTHYRACASCGSVADTSPAGRYCARQVAVSTLSAPPTSTPTSMSYFSDSSDPLLAQQPSTSITVAATIATASVDADAYYCHLCERANNARHAPGWGPGVESLPPSSLPPKRNLEVLPVAYHGWCARVPPRDRTLTTVQYGGDWNMSVARMLRMVVDPASPDCGLCRIEH
jgi:hypothetical protein